MTTTPHLHHASAAPAVRAGMVDVIADRLAEALDTVPVTESPRPPWHALVAGTAAPSPGQELTARRAVLAATDRRDRSALAARAQMLRTTLHRRIGALLHPSRARDVRELRAALAALAAAGRAAAHARALDALAPALAEIGAVQPAAAAPTTGPTPERAATDPPPPTGRLLAAVLIAAPAAPPRIRAAACA